MAAKSETVTYASLQSEMSKGIFRPIYVLHGEEAYYIDKLQELIIDKALTEDERDFNLTIFYGADCDVRNVIAACKRYPVMAERQVVVLREAQNLKKNMGEGADLDLFKFYAQNPLKSTVLVICNKEGKLKAPEFLKELKANPACGVAYESAKLKENMVGSVIQNYVTSKGCAIDGKSVAMMKDFVGTDISRLVGELDKLCMLVESADRNITPAVIERNIGVSKDYNNFELEAAICNRDAEKAYRIVEYYKRNPKNNPVQPTCSYLFSFFSLLLLTCTAPDRNPSAVAARIGKTPYRAGTFISAAQKYNTRQCVSIISFIRQFDAQSKGIGSRQNEYDLLKDLIYKIFHA